ncbi:anthranilate phosphoribosyltransferase [Peptococcaceae bacterium]|nr:anthranilate phosphoribosyltransferase [Peptococcaceae bacterium]
MLSQLLNKVVEGEDLTAEEAAGVMSDIMSGKLTEAQAAALLVALIMKGESVEEIASFAKVMRENAVKVKSKHESLVDTCGTGGDGKNTFNISTAAAIVMAASGAKVAKHGNRSVSSKCGSADVLEELGVVLDLTPEQMGKCLDEVGICFLFAPKLHPAMKHVVPVRKQIGIRTVFNILGPLTNPAGAQYQVLGVYSEKLVEKMAEVLAKLGAKRAFVLFGAGGLDEISPVGEAKVCEVRDGEVVKEFTVDPLKLGVERCSVEDLAGGDVRENAEIIRKVLSGGERSAKRNAVLINAALGLVCVGIVDDMKSGMEVAAQSIDSGAAMKKLNELVEFTKVVC